VGGEEGPLRREPTKYRLRWTKTVTEEILTEKSRAERISAFVYIPVSVTTFAFVRDYERPAVRKRAIVRFSKLS
jgi:hypothetical protein